MTRPKKYDRTGYVFTDEHEAVLKHCKQLASQLFDRTRERDQLLRKLELQEDALRAAQAAIRPRRRGEAVHRNGELA